MLKLGNIDKWTRIEAGKAFAFADSRRRRVRLEVNAPGEAQLYYAGDDGEVTFLGAVKGRDVIEFGASGGFSLAVEGNDVWLYTTEGEEVHHVNHSPTIFTKIIERRPRNLEFEMMQYQMNRNLELRLEAMRGDIERAFNRRVEADAAAAAQPPASGGVGGTFGQSQSNGQSDGSGGSGSADVGSGSDTGAQA